MKRVFLSLAVIILFSIFIVVNSPKASAQCVADKPILTAKTGTKGDIMLNWNQVANGNRYALVYGFSSNNYMFGALSIDGGTNTNYTVTMLNPSTKYFFQIWAFCSDDGPATPSNEVSITAP